MLASQYKPARGTSELLLSVYSNVSKFTEASHNGNHSG